MDFRNEDEDEDEDEDVDEDEDEDLDERGRDMKNFVEDRLRINKLVLKVASWVDSAVARRVELWEDTLVIPPALAAPLVLPPALAARAAVLAFGDELLDLVLPDESGEISDSCESSDESSDSDGSSGFGESGESDSGSESGECGESSQVELRWRQPGGRIFAASYLLPRAEAALRQELQRLADAAKRARLGQTSSSSGSRAT